MLVDRQPRPVAIAACHAAAGSSPSAAGTGCTRRCPRCASSPTDLTAVVTVADDGGSSGRIRRELGLLPPGDLRMALAALAGDERRRRSCGPTCCSTASADRGALAGHPVGNLLLTGLLERLAATRSPRSTGSAALLGAVGRVLPMCPVPLDLVAEVDRLDPRRPGAHVDDPRPGRDRRARRVGSQRRACCRRARRPAPAAVDAVRDGRRGRARARLVVHQRDPAPAGAASWRTRCTHDRGPASWSCSTCAAAGRDRRFSPQDHLRGAARARARPADRRGDRRRRRGRLTRDRLRALRRATYRRASRTVSSSAADDGRRPARSRAAGRGRSRGVRLASSRRHDTRP